MEQVSINFDSPLLSLDEEAVLSCLGKGRQAATSSTEITRRTGLTVRRIQQVVRKLRLEHGYSIGSATDIPMGYYITDEQGDNVEMARKLRARGIKVLMLAARFSKRSLAMEFSQGIIEMEQDGEQWRKP